MSGCPLEVKIFQTKTDITMKNETQKSDEAGNLHKPPVMRSLQDIEKLEKEIRNQKGQTIDDRFNGLEYTADCREQLIYTLEEKLEKLKANYA